jgi:2-haloacid dehalogenase
MHIEKMNTMKLTRRTFITIGALSTASALFSNIVNASESNKIQAIAFDGFVIFDPRPIFLLASELYPEQGKELSKLWLSKQFGYTWLLSSAGEYQDFWNVTENALDYAAQSLSIALTQTNRNKLMHAYLNLQAWPDAKAALEQLRANNIRLAFLSNFTEQMMVANIKSASLEGIFEFSLSTDRVQVYKPNPKAYQMGLDAFGLAKSEVLFAASAGWDSVGATWFGYPTVWVNRLMMPAEHIGQPPLLETTNMGGLLQLAVLNNKA